MAKHIPAWRKLELVVAELEEFLSAKGVEVKSPDFIECSRTHKPVQVDVSLRFEGVGSKKTLGLIECRKRGRPAGPDWIRQLAELRIDLRADFVMAVSAVGFTSTARELARAKGIPIRSIRDATALSMAEWILETGPHLHVRMVAPFIRYLGMQFAFFDRTGERITLATQHFDEARGGSVRSLDEPLGRSVGGEKVTLGTLLDDFLSRDGMEEKYMSPPEGQPFVLGFHLQIKPEYLYVDTSGGDQVEATGLELHCRMVRNSKVLPTTVEQRLEYQTEDGALAWHNTVSGYHEELDRGFRLTYLERRFKEDEQPPE